MKILLFFVCVPEQETCFNHCFFIYNKRSYLSYPVKNSIKVKLLASFNDDIIAILVMADDGICFIVAGVRYESTAIITPTGKWGMRVSTRCS